MPRGVYVRTPENTRRRRSVEDNFWAKVAVGEPDECWLWTAATQGPYGQFWFGKRPWKAHRVSWVLTHGSIDPLLDCCHSCDTPKCVNPKHLWLGTAKDNMADCSAKNRTFRGQWTHCLHGHEFTPENTAIRFNGMRRCRICERARNQESRRKKRGNS